MEEKRAKRNLVEMREGEIGRGGPQALFDQVQAVETLAPATPACARPAGCTKEEGKKEEIGRAHV